MFNQIKVGDKAPNFILPDENTKPTTLEEFLGNKIILVFFVGAFTSTCTKEICEFRDSMAQLIDLQAQIIGIDITVPSSNKRFSEKNRLPFPVLADYKREVFQKYGLDFPHCTDSGCCWGSGCYPIAKPSIFLLDQQGIIRYMWVSDNSAADPNYLELKRVFERISQPLLVC